METPIKDPTIHKDLGKLALEIWKVEKRLHKLDQKLSEDDKKGFSFLMERIYSALEKYGIHITDNTGQKYIEGMNGIDVVSVEAQEGLEQVIGEVITPTLEINGEITQRAKAIIKDLKTFEEEKVVHKQEEKADTKKKKKINWKKIVSYGIVVIILLGAIQYFCKDKFQSKPTEQTPISIAPPVVTPPELTGEIQAPEIIEPTPIEESKYPLIDFKSIIEQNQLFENRLDEMQNFTPYEVFKTLGLHRKTDKTKFGITPGSAKNNLQIRDILIEELRQHISHS